MKTLLLIALALTTGLRTPQALDPAAVAGDWYGTLDAGVQKLRLAIHVTKASDGTLGAKFDSLDQGALGLPVDSIGLQGRTLSFQMARLAATFHGTVSDDGQTIAGTFQQGGGQLPLTFSRTPQAAVSHPQEPKPPFPYSAEDVTYPGGAAGVTMAGTLTIPRGAGPFPAVFLITGSGAQDRDEAMVGHRPFLLLADYLTRAGIIVLRADDRGFGKSTGAFATATTLDFAGDAEAAVKFLATRPEVAKAKIGLVGHSEGGLIAPIVASRTGNVAYVVLLAGSGVNGAQILLWQQEVLLRANGASDAAIAGRRKTMSAAYAELQGTDRSPAMWARIDKILADGGLGADERALGVAQLRSPWMQQFLTLDPVPYLKQVKVPVLALNGSLDTQVDPKLNLPAIRAALEASGNRNVEADEMPGLNHLFQHAKTGLVTEYQTSEETMSPEVLAKVRDWILARTAAQ